MSLDWQQKTKRGDTIIEAMFAFAIFAMVAIVSVMIMNSGIAASERSLELVTARNELNAQAEALRFIHSSYIAEKNLKPCGEAGAGEKCRQFEGLWTEIISGARVSSSDTASANAYSIPLSISSCAEIYEENPTTHENKLEENNAFIINTRELKSNNGAFNTNPIIRAVGSSDIFVEPTLGARLLYSSGTNFIEDDNSADNTSGMKTLVGYRNLVRAEGIWVVAVEGQNTGSGIPYYDFYIDTCWYGSGASAPTTLDAVVRLYNPRD